MRKKYPVGPWFIALLVFFLAPVLVGLSGCSVNDLKFDTEYQAILLDNGQVFFAKVGEAGAPFMLLQDVFYIQRVAEAGKKEPVNILLKRGSEWHGPEFMRINARHVVFIEPVAANSRVAQLIKEAKAAPPHTAAPKEGTPPPVAAPPEEKPAPPPAAPAAPPREEKRPPARR